MIRSGLANIFKCSQLLVVKILSAIQFKCKRATQLPSRAALSVHSSTPELFRSSLPPFGLRISLERTAFILLCCIFSVSLWAPVFCTFYLLGSLVSFCTLFSLLFLQWNTGTISVKRLGWWGQHLIKNCVSFLCCKDWVGALAPDQKLGNYFLDCEK